MTAIMNTPYWKKAMGAFGSTGIERFQGCLAVLEALEECPDIEGRDDLKKDTCINLLDSVKSSYAEYWRNWAAGRYEGRNPPWLSILLEVIDDDPEFSIEVTDADTGKTITLFEATGWTDPRQ